MIDGDELVIGDIVIANDLESIEVDGKDISGFDEDYLTSYGITIGNPDDATDDQRIDIVIPEEQLFADISVISK